MIEKVEALEKKIQKNYLRVLECIENAVVNSENPLHAVKLVVVTKKQPVEIIQAVIDAGAQFIGENYADEALPKIEALRGNEQIQWHMIGHVQSRKAELVCKNFDFVHSLDSLKLAKRYDHFARETQRILPVLLEFNVSGEASKSGWDAWEEQEWEMLIPDIELIIGLENVQVHGLMTMPPYSDNPEDSRAFFRKLRRLRDFIASQFPDADWSELSMGMSGDFEIAVQEGATWVRVGQAILGPRP